MFFMTVYLIVLIVIGLISMAAFSSPALMARFQLNPWSVVHRKEYVRVLSHAFLHVDWMHLLINVFVLFSFSRAVVFYFSYYLPGNAEDRKSTRLNSSHVRISYAVFCLKK